MEIEIENTEDFKNGINAVNELIDEGKIRFTKNNFSIKETDPTNIAMINFNLGKENFKNYNIEKDIEICISFVQFNQILKRTKSNNIILDIKENSIEILLKDKNIKKFVIPILELGNEKIPEINIEPKARIKINNSIFNEAILDAGIIGETLSLSINKNSLKFFSQENMNKVETNLKKENILFFECLEESTSKYPLEYLKKVEKGSKISNIIKLEFGKDYPLRATYENKDNNISIIYILAPRVDND